MKTFVLANLSKDFTITIDKKEFSLKEGCSYRFNYANKNNVKEVLKCLAKNKGLFRYIETTDYINCVQTFSLAKDRASVESTKVSEGFKNRKKKSDEIIKVATPESEEGRGVNLDDLDISLGEDISE